MSWMSWRMGLARGGLLQRYVVIFVCCFHPDHIRLFPSQIQHKTLSLRTLVPVGDIGLRAKPDYLFLKPYSKHC